MTTLLLAVGDAVEASRSIFQVVDRARRDDGCRVVVLHVHETATDRLGPYDVSAEPPGSCLAVSVAEVLVGQGISAESLVLDRPAGLLPEAIVDAALEIGADVVYVGAVPGWCRPAAHVAADVGRMLGARADLRTVS